MQLDLDFTATVEDADIYGINKYLGCSEDIDIDTGKPTCYIDYELQPEARRWGIKSIYICIRKLTASIEWETSADDISEKDKAALLKAGGTEYRDETIGGTIEINTTQQEFEIENEINFRDDGAFSIDNVSIELTDKTITLS